MEQPISLRDRANKLVSFFFPKDEVTLRKETVEKANNDFLMAYRQDKDEQVFGHAHLTPTKDDSSTREAVEKGVEEQLKKRISNIESFRVDWEHVLDDPLDLKIGENYKVLTGVEYAKKKNEDYTDTATVFIVYK